MRFFILFLCPLCASAAVTVTNGSITYSSSRDPIANLYAEITYPTLSNNMPVVLMVHPWGGGAGSYTTNMRTVLANNGWFVVSPGMRGRDGADGGQDDGGREVLDVVDALTAVTNIFKPPITTNYFAILGASAGGADALLVAARYPDLFSVYVDYFGISDYGVDGTTSWYNEVPANQSDLRAHIGGSPAAVPGNYLARYARTAVASNLFGGLLYVFHNSLDETVFITHSTNVVKSFNALARTNYVYNYSTTLYDHHLPGVGDGYAFDSMDLWQANLNARNPAEWTFPESGRCLVAGWLETKRFKIWLDAGTNHSANLTFNTVTRSYTVTPISAGTMSVAIFQGTKSNVVSLSSETTITLDQETPGVKANLRGAARITKGTL